MKTVFSICFFLLLSFTVSAQPNEIEFKAPDRYPEGVVYDSKSGMFYVSGVRRGTIGSVDSKGKYTELLADSSLKSIYGMKISGNMLWACTSDANFSKYKSPATYKKIARLIAIDLKTGKKSRDIDLAALYPGDHFANDLAFDGEGNSYVTDSYSPVIYKINASGTASVFAKNELFNSVGVGLNGIVWHPEGYLLAVNGGTGSVLKISMDGQQVTKVKIPYFFSGGDGLLLDANKDLILVQNKGVNKVFRIRSTNNWQNAKIIARTNANAMFSYPSTATMRNGGVWVMNAKLNELAEGNKVPSETFTIQQAKFENVP